MPNFKKENLNKKNTKMKKAKNGRKKYINYNLVIFIFYHFLI